MFTTFVSTAETDDRRDQTQRLHKDIIEQKNTSVCQTAGCAKRNARRREMRYAEFMAIVVSTHVTG